MAKQKLETEVNNRLDTIVEDEVRAGWKVMALDEHYQKLLIEDELPRLPYIRFLRMNPARKRKVAELVQRRYHLDLQDESLLSEAQVKVLAAKRGEWTPDHDKRLTEATERANLLMQQLYAAGFASGSERWVADLNSVAETVREAIGADVPMLDRFNRWLDYTPDKREAYTASYAAGQGREQYSPDNDYSAITAHSLAVGDLVDQLDDLKQRVENYYDLLKLRGEQLELQVKRDRLFDQTAEARRDQAEEIARLYVTATVCDTQGAELGPLALSFERLWDFPFEVLQYLTSEAYLFHNNIPDEARAYLEVFGFLVPRPPSGVDTPSVESPVAATPSSDSQPSDTTPADTSASATVTT